MRRRTIILSTILAAVIGFITVHTPRVAFMRANADEIPDQIEKQFSEDLKEQIGEKEFLEVPELPKLPDKPNKDYNFLDVSPATKATTFQNIPLVDNNLLFIANYVDEEWVSRAPSVQTSHPADTFIFPTAVLPRSIQSDSFDFTFGPYGTRNDPDLGTCLTLTGGTTLFAGAENDIRIFIFTFLYSEEAETELPDYQVIVYVGAGRDIEFSIDSIVPNPIEWYYLTSIQVLQSGLTFGTKDDRYTSPVPFFDQALDQNCIRSPQFYFPSYTQIYRDEESSESFFGGHLVVMQTSGTGGFALNQSYGSVSFSQGNIKLRYNGPQTTEQSYFISPDQPFSLDNAFIYEQNALHQGNFYFNEGAFSRYGTEDNYFTIVGGDYIQNSNVLSCRPAFEIFYIAPFTAINEPDPAPQPTEKIETLNWDGAANVITNIFTIAIGGGTAILGAVVGFFYGFGDGIAKGLGFGDLFRHAGTMASSFFNATFNAFNRLFQRIIKPVVDFIITVIEGAGEILEDLIEQIPKIAKNWRGIAIIAIGLGVFLLINSSLRGRRE